MRHVTDDLLGLRSGSTQEHHTYQEGRQEPSQRSLPLSSCVAARQRVAHWLGTHTQDMQGAKTICKEVQKISNIFVMRTQE